MGKGTIISGGENGLYQVRVTYNRDRYNDTIAALNTKKDDLEEKWAPIQTERDAKQSEVDLKTGEASTMADEYQELLSNLETYQQQMVQLENDLSVLQKELSDLRESGVASEWQIEDKEREIGEKQLEITEKQTQIDETKTAAEEIVNEYEAVMKEANDLNFELIEIQSRLNDINLQITAIEKRIQLLEESMPADKTVSAWCADLTEDITGDVGTVEVPGEVGIIQIYPGYIDEEDVAEMIEQLAAAAARINELQNAIEDEIVDEEPVTDPPEIDGESKKANENPKGAAKNPSGASKDPGGASKDPGGDAEWSIGSNKINIDPEGIAPIDESVEGPLTGDSVINGIIKDVNMANLEGIKVTAYRKEGTGDDEKYSYVTSTTTDENGAYDLGGLSSGTYRLKFNDPDGNYLTEYYDGKNTLDDGTDIVVGAATTVSGKNASLGNASSITGTVTDTV